MVAGAAHAAIVNGAFSGTVTSGYASGNFGYGDSADLAGKAIAGTFQYDTALLSPNCASGTYFFGCFLGTGMTITQTINGMTEVFGGTPSLDPQKNNTAKSGLLLYNLVGDAVNLHTLSMIGDPATVYNQSETGLAFSLAPGAIADATNPVLNYDGAAGDSIGGYRIGGQLFAANHSQIYQLTAGFYTQRTAYDFTVESFSSSAAPEPAAWALMLMGFGAAGLMIRARRPRLAAA